MVERTSADLDRTAIRRMYPVIVERLRQVFPERYFGIERVPSTLSMTEFKRVLRCSPFIGVGWVGMEKDTDSGRILKGRMKWRLVMIVKASNSLAARFEGDHSDIGLDAMVDVATAILQGHVFDCIGHCSVTGADAVYAEGHEDDDVVLAHVNFEIACSAPIADLKLKSAEDFKVLHVTWAVTGPDAQDCDLGVTQQIDPTQKEEP